MGLLESQVAGAVARIETFEHFVSHILKRVRIDQAGWCWAARSVCRDARVLWEHRVERGLSSRSRYFEPSIGDENMPT